MQVQVNGRLTDLAEGTTIQALIEAHDLVPRYVVVEHNGEALDRSAYAATALADGDRVELVRAVAGGGRSGRWRRERLSHGRIYCCCDRREETADLADFLDAILGAGVDLVQLRDKHATPDQIAAAAPVFRDAALRHDALFILNDDPVLAAALDADGVHVGQDDAAPADARAAVGADRLIGVSTHTVPEVDAAIAEDCDYFAVGPVHATPTKAGRRPVGLGPLHHAFAVADRPWFVTGGMTVDTAAPVLATGARGLVVVRAFTEADDPAHAVRRLRTIVDTA